MAKQGKKSLPPKVAFLVGGSGDDLPGQNNFTTEFNEWNAFLRDQDWHVYGFVDSAKKTE